MCMLHVCVCLSAPPSRQLQHELSIITCSQICMHGCLRKLHTTFKMNLFQIEFCNFQKPPFIYRSIPGIKSTISLGCSPKLMNCLMFLNVLFFVLPLLHVTLSETWTKNKFYSLISIVETQKKLYNKQTIRNLDSYQSNICSSCDHMIGLSQIQQIHCKHADCDR